MFRWTKPHQENSKMKSSAIGKADGIAFFVVWIV